MMKTLVICIVSNNYESEIVKRLESTLAYRLNDCHVMKIKVGNGFFSRGLVRICKEACENGCKRIYIQPATLAFSSRKYIDLMEYIEGVRISQPDIELTIFPPAQLHRTCVDVMEQNVYHAALKDIPFVTTPPKEIQDRSFDFISRRLAKKYDDQDTKSVVVRIIHATADFGIEDLLVFSHDAVAKGKEALANGCKIITDVGMVSAGLKTRFANITICAINMHGVKEISEENGLTRSAAGFELLAENIEGTVIAIGNAPTALVHLLSIMRRTDVRPACIVGVPVGFVGAAESKELLMNSDIPFISIKGNRGGTPIAVAAVNAIGCL